MKQPALGLVSAVVGMAMAMGFISLFDLPTFNGWVAFIALCFIPMSIVAGITWGAALPFAPGLRQPARGLVLLATTALVAIAAGYLIIHQGIGEDQVPPGPIPTHFAIIAVVWTFWMAIMMGGWPVTAAVKAALPAGAGVLIAAYAVTYAVFRIFFDYDFLAGTPVHLPSAPRGLYMAILPLVFCVTHVAAMFLFLLFDLWPFTVSPRLMAQPVLGIVWTAAALVIVSIAMYAGVVVMGVDPMVFLTRVTVPFIFGSIMMLNMFQNSLFAALRQPAKGIANTALAIVAGLALAALYGRIGPALVGPLVSGPPSYDYEIWLANALLGITFPVLVFQAVYFDFWPFRRGAVDRPPHAAAR